MNKRREDKNFNLSVPGKTTLKKNFICNKELNSALINCRSLKPKLGSMIECFNVNKLTIALLNETWLVKTDKQVRKQMRGIKDEHGITVIRKDGNSRGEGVAVAFNERDISLKKN